MLKKAFQEFQDQIEQPEISMTPLIDMIFILLIFFVVTTTFSKETGIKVEKTESATATMIDNKMLLIAIDSSNNFWMMEEKRELESLLPIVTEKYRADSLLQVVIIPDKRSSVEPLLLLMDKLRAEKITRYTLGTKQVKNDNNE